MILETSHFAFIFISHSVINRTNKNGKSKRQRQKTKEERAIDKIPDKVKGKKVKLKQARAIYEGLKEDFSKYSSNGYISKREMEREEPEKLAEMVRLARMI